MTQDPFIHDLLRFLVTTSVLLIFIASQLFWLRALYKWSRKIIPSRLTLAILGAGLVFLYGLLFMYNFVWFRHEPSATHLTLAAVLLEAPFRWWVVSSVLGFATVGVFWLAGRGLSLAAWALRKVAGAGRSQATSADGVAPNAPPAPTPDDPPGDLAPEAERLGSLSFLSRRKFLERAAFAASSVPFVACAYGLTLGRLDIETTRRRIQLARLPKAFDGFRVVQLSDFHIGPFMTANEIRKVVRMANDLKPDLIALTGDYVTWDPSTQGEVVEVLSGLRAPYGVVGCLGNHELWTDCEDSITRLFRARHIPMLRKERAPVHSGGETLNIIGVDYESVRRGGPSPSGIVRRYLEGVEPLIMPDTANILLTHNPNPFDRAAELGIDLSLAGHTHGGQVTLEFIHKNLSPSRLITDYVRGWFSKPGGQLYVNRGIGTFGVPIRMGASPEITVFELVREA